MYVYLQRVANSPNLVLPEVETREKNTSVHILIVKLYVHITFLEDQEHLIIMNSNCPSENLGQDYQQSVLNV